MSRLFALLLTGALAGCSAAPSAPAPAPIHPMPSAFAASPEISTPLPAPATPRPTTLPTVAPLPTSSAATAWRRYVSPSGPAIFVPATWAVVDPGLYGSSVSFAAAPAGPDVPLDRQPVLAAIHVLRRDRPFTAATDLADTVQALIPGLAKAERAVGTHPSGAVVILKYTLEIGDLPLLEEADALFVKDGVGVILGMRAPAERMDEYADTFQELFERFRL